MERHSSIVWRVNFDIRRPAEHNAGRAFIWRDIDNWKNEVCDRSAALTLFSFFAGSRA